MGVSKAEDLHFSHSFQVKPSKLLHQQEKEFQIYILQCFELNFKVKFVRSRFLRGILKASLWLKTLDKSSI